jgi:hypothetical protein
MVIPPLLFPSPFPLHLLASATAESEIEHSPGHMYSTPHLSTSQNGGVVPLNLNAAPSCDPPAAGQSTAESVPDCIAMRALHCVRGMRLSSSIVKLHPKIRLPRAGASCKPKHNTIVPVDTRMHTSDHRPRPHTCARRTQLFCYGKGRV